MNNNIKTNIGSMTDTIINQCIRKLQNGNIPNIIMAIIKNEIKPYYQTIILAFTLLIISNIYIIYTIHKKY